MQRCVPVGVDRVPLVLEWDGVNVTSGMAVGVAVMFGATKIYCSFRYEHTHSGDYHHTYLRRTSRMAWLLSNVPFPLLAMHHISVSLWWMLTDVTVRVVLVPLVDTE